MLLLLPWFAWLAAAYLVGSIPFGLLLAKAKGVDIRKHGSGNIGATNVMRVMGKKLGITCFLLDVIKGAAPAVVSAIANDTIGVVNLSQWQALGWIAVAFASVLGHVFPVWLKFKGGKGVATSFGALAGLYPIMTFASVVALVVFIVSLKWTRYVGLSSSLAALTIGIAGVLAPLLTMLIPPELFTSHDSIAHAYAGLWPFSAISVLLASLVILRHKGNLARTLQGTEHRVGSDDVSDTSDEAPGDAPTA